MFPQQRSRWTNAAVPQENLMEQKKYQYNWCVSAGSPLIHKKGPNLLCRTIVLAFFFWRSQTEPAVNKLTTSLSLSRINRASVSWQPPSCTSSSWRHSAGFSQRPGSPTWQWRERFGPGSSANASCVWAGVSKQHVFLSLILSSYLPSCLAALILSQSIRSRCLSMHCSLLSQIVHLSGSLCWYFCAPVRLSEGWVNGPALGSGGDSLARLSHSRSQWPYEPSISTEALCILSQTNQTKV